MRKAIDWAKPIHLVTNQGIRKCKVIGKNLNDKTVVEIEHFRQSLEPFFIPDDSGYVVEFDRWIENIPTEQYLSIKILNWEAEYGHVNIMDTPEGLEVWIGGEFRYRQKRS